MVNHESWSIFFFSFKSPIKKAAIKFIDHTTTGLLLELSYHLKGACRIVLRCCSRLSHDSHIGTFRKWWLDPIPRIYLSSLGPKTPTVLNVQHPGNHNHCVYCKFLSSFCSSLEESMNSDQFIMTLGKIIPKSSSVGESS